MTCSCKTKKTYLRLYSADRTSGTNTSPIFQLSQQILKIKGFQIKKFLIDQSNPTIASKTMKINSRELSNLTTDTLVGSHNGATNTIIEIDISDNWFNQLADSIVYTSQNGRLSTISFDFKDEAGTAATANMAANKWSMLICFYHDA